MSSALRIASLVSAVLFVPAISHGQSPAAQSPGPTFRGAVDLVTVDLTVVDHDGTPVAGLAPGDVTVLVDGSPRRVTSLVWLPPSGAPDESALGNSRSIVLVVDRASLRPGHGMQALHAAARYLDALPASARVAVAVLPDLAGAVRFDEPRTVLRDRLLRALGTGRRTVTLGQTSDDHVNALFTSLSSIEGPKQVILIQGTESGEIGAPIDFAAHDLFSAALSAWQSRVIVHQLDVWENPAWEAMAPENRTSTTPIWTRTSATDRILSTQTGGLAMAPISGDAFFTRFTREQAGSYVLAFEPSDSDRDGRSHTIKVTVSGPDTTIRARHDFSIMGATGSH